jgi:superfamily II DNA or RNA helicase
MEPDRIVTPDGKTFLEPHQVRVVKHMRQHRGLLVVHEMGSGKTLSALMVIHEWLAANELHRAVFIASELLQSNLMIQANRFGFRPEFEVAMRNKRLVLISKQKFGRQCQHIDLAQTLVVMDEAHNIRTNVFEAARAKPEKASGAVARDAQASRSAAQASFGDEWSSRPPPTDKYGAQLENSHIDAIGVVRCMARAAKVLLMTGTPMVNTPYDLVNLLCALRQHDFIPPCESLHKGSDALAEAFNGLISYHKIPDDDTRFPKLRFHRIEVEVKDEELLETMRQACASNPAFLQGARRGSNAVHANGNVDEKMVMVKQPDILKVLKSNPGLRTIIYTTYVGVGVDAISTFLGEAQLPHFAMKGATRHADRHAMVARFNAGERPILVLSKVGGEGLDLKEVRRVLIVENAFNSNTQRQAIARARRRDSHAELAVEDRVVDVYTFITVFPDKEHEIRNTGDEVLEKMCKKKDDLIKAMWKRLHPFTIENEARAGSGGTLQWASRPVKFKDQGKPNGRGGALAIGGGGYDYNPNPLVKANLSNESDESDEEGREALRDGKGEREKTRDIPPPASDAFRLAERFRRPLTADPGTQTATGPGYLAAECGSRAGERRTREVPVASFNDPPAKAEGPESGVSRPPSRKRRMDAMEGSCPKRAKRTQPRSDVQILIEKECAKQGATSDETRHIIQTHFTKFLKENPTIATIDPTQIRPAVVLALRKIRGKADGILGWKPAFGTTGRGMVAIRPPSDDIESRLKRAADQNRLTRAPRATKTARLANERGFMQYNNRKATLHPYNPATRAPPGRVTAYPRRDNDVQPAPARSVDIFKVTRPTPSAGRGARAATSADIASAPTRPAPPNKTPKKAAWPGSSAGQGAQAAAATKAPARYRIPKKSTSPAHTISWTAEMGAWRDPPHRTG